MTTSPTTDYVTKAQFERAVEHIDATFVTKGEFQHAMERIDAKFDLLDARMETRIERATATSIRWTVGIALSQYALILGVILFFVSREIPYA